MRSSEVSTATDINNSANPVSEISSSEERRLYATSSLSLGIVQTHVSRGATMSSKYESGLSAAGNSVHEDTVHRGKKRVADDMLPAPATLSEPSSSALLSTPVRKCESMLCIVDFPRSLTSLTLPSQKGYHEALPGL